MIKLGAPEVVRKGDWSDQGHKRYCCPRAISGRGAKDHEGLAKEHLQ